jgi:hypothetical protein
MGFAVRESRVVVDFRTVFPINYPAFTEEVPTTG